MAALAVPIYRYGTGGMDDFGTLGKICVVKASTKQFAPRQKDTHICRLAAWHNLQMSGAACLGPSAPKSDSWRLLCTSNGENEADLSWTVATDEG